MPDNMLEDQAEVEEARRQGMSVTELRMRRVCPPGVGAGILDDLAPGYRASRQAAAERQRQREAGERVVYDTRPQPEPLRKPRPAEVPIESPPGQSYIARMVDTQDAVDRRLACKSLGIAEPAWVAERLGPMVEPFDGERPTMRRS
jgi:hypothetical protein